MDFMAVFCVFYCLFCNMYDETEEIGHNKSTLSIADNQRACLFLFPKTKLFPIPTNIAKGISNFHPEL